MRDRDYQLAQLALHICSMNFVFLWDGHLARLPALVLVAIRKYIFSTGAKIHLDHQKKPIPESGLRGFKLLGCTIITTPEEIDVVLGVLADVLKPVPIYFQWRPQLRDPNDEMVLECAINAQASAIVTFNEGDFLPAAQQF